MTMETMQERATAQARTNGQALVPPLESGDRLTRLEFERRYEAMPATKKAELIEGVVYVGSPVRFQSHAEPHAWLVGWLTVYMAATPGVRLADNPTVRLDADNEVQPDALLRIEPARGGRSWVSADDYIEGAPELVVEIAASSASYDLHDKLKVYRRCGVQEYLVWQVFEREIHWWELHEGVYVPLPADAAGVVASKVFPGLRLAVASLRDDDLAGVLTSLQQSLGAAEHQAFVERLRAPISGDK